MKPLSEQFADLSVRTKKAEDSVTAARKDSHDRVVAARDKARAKRQKMIRKEKEFEEKLGLHPR